MTSLDKSTPTMWLHTVLFKQKTYKIWQPLSKAMQIHSTQVKNKRIEIVTCSKLAAIEPELYCKITPMYKCCWHWTNQCLVNKQCRIQSEQWPVQSQPAHCKCKGNETSDTCCWHETNQDLVKNNRNNDLFKVSS